MTKTGLLIGFVCLALLAGAPARATTVLEKSFATLVQEAEIIAAGSVTAIAAEWDADREVPFTLVTFSNLDILKGAAATPLTLRFLGGPTPDGSLLQIAGVPQFTIGERHVLFVAGNDHYAVPLVGIWQGVYRVVFDSTRGVDTIQTHAGQPLTTLPPGPPGGQQALSDDSITSGLSASPQDGMSLETFSQFIEQEVSRND